MAAEQVLAEALLRIEHKLDVLLNTLGFGQGVHPQLHFVGQSCPVCKMPIDYQIDIVHNVAVRRCGCKSGKIPSTIPLTITTPQGDKTHGPAADAAVAGGSEAPSAPEEGRRRQGR